MRLTLWTIASPKSEGRRRSGRGAFNSGFVRAHSSREAKTHLKKVVYKQEPFRLQGQKPGNKVRTHHMKK